METFVATTFSASSPSRSRASRSAKSTNALPQSLNAEGAMETGEPVESKLSYSDLLLSRLQALIGELSDEGVGVTLHDSASSGLIVILAGTHFCQTHNLMHVGQTCPLC